LLDCREPIETVAHGARISQDNASGKPNEEGRHMPSLKHGALDALYDIRESGLVRPAAEKFAGAWLACFLVMARGNVLAAFSFEHARLASICGIVGAVVTVALLVQMDRTTDSLFRQATISAIATFIGDIFAHPSHFPPQWAEPTVTAAVAAGIAIVVWYAKRLAKTGKFKPRMDRQTTR
jgi:hypothetical protein